MLTINLNKRICDTEGVISMPTRNLPSKWLESLKKTSQLDLFAQQKTQINTFDSNGGQNLGFYWEILSSECPLSPTQGRQRFQVSGWEKIEYETLPGNVTVDV